MLHIRNPKNLPVYKTSWRFRFLNFSRGQRALQLSTMKCLRWRLALLSVEWLQVKVLPEALDSSSKTIWQPQTVSHLFQNWGVSIQFRNLIPGCHVQKKATEIRQGAMVFLNQTLEYLLNLKAMPFPNPSTSHPSTQEFPRRWLPDPALSPLGSTYGYYQLQRQESGLGYSDGTLDMGWRNAGMTKDDHVVFFAW